MKFHLHVLQLAPLLSNLAYHVARCSVKPFKNLLIWAFTRCYRLPKMPLAAFPNFNSFFVRKANYEIKVNAEDKGLTSPVEGQVVGLGTIQLDGKICAKQHCFSLTSLLGGDHEAAKHFENGQFMVFYLAPYNYHRVHAPLGGTVKKVCYVPGSLFSVKPECAAKHPDLLARNERVIIYLETKTLGLVALVLVGAALVSGIELVWQGIIKAKKLITLQLQESFKLQQGEELGRFNFGSSVVLLLPITATKFFNLKALDGLTSVRAGSTLTI